MKPDLQRRASLRIAGADQAIPAPTSRSGGHRPTSPTVGGGDTRGRRTIVRPSGVRARPSPRRTGDGVAAKPAGPWYPAEGPGPRPPPRRRRPDALRRPVDRRRGSRRRLAVVSRADALPLVRPGRRLARLALRHDGPAALQ